MSDLCKGELLDVPIYATTQNRKALGETISELGLATDNASRTVVHVDKTAFSMAVPQVLSDLKPPPQEIILVGIEAHICVTQTTLDLLAMGHKVYVLTDGVSSCNKEEIPIALRRLAKEGAIITTSESFLYELMGDARIPQFKSIASLVKEEKQSTRDILQTLCKI